MAENVAQGQVWAGLIDGKPAVVRVQNPPDTDGVHVIALHSEMRGRTATISLEAFGSRLRLVSSNPHPSYAQVSAWLEGV